jgi:hypothetical protein
MTGTQTAYVEGEQYCTQGRSPQKSPKWVLPFIERVDRGRIFTNITARTCLRILDAIP